MTLLAADFKEALVAVVSAGGDTDTNGTVAGAVLGARFGCRAIPPRWRGAVANLHPGRPSMESWADRLSRSVQSANRATTKPPAEDQMSNGDAQMGVSCRRKPGSTGSPAMAAGSVRRSTAPSAW